jgi:arylsulfatase A-like enzyme
MRYLTVLLFFTLITSLLVCCGEQNVPQKDKPERPNILFIVVDDLGNHDLGVTGSQIYETPHIDGIAAHGTMFTAGYANSAVCSPSRASLLSGRYVTNHGVTDWIGAKTGEAWREQKRSNKLLPPDYEHRLSPVFTTLPEVLKQRNYRTFFAGKWHLGGEQQASLPTNHGFDVNVGGFHGGSPANGRYFAPFNNPQMADYPADKGQCLSERLASETASFLEQKDTTPFFAMLSFYGVHGPIQTSQPKWKKYRDKIVAMGVADDGFKMGRMLPIRQVQDDPIYAGLVEQVDDAVGIVLEKLEELNLADNTIVVFTSDNGGVAAGDNYSTSNAPLRGGKGYQFEGGTRVPYFIYIPWLKQAPKTNSTPVMGMDLYPTLVELAGGTSSSSIDGTSLLPLLTGNTLPKRPLFWHYPHYGNQGGEPSSTVRYGDYKLIRYWEDDRRELYQLSNDPGEQNDIFAKEPEAAANLDRRLSEWLRATDARIPLTDPAYAPAKEAAVFQRFATKKMPYLEELRKQRLTEDYQPNKDWWGSAVD